MFNTRVSYPVSYLCFIPLFHTRRSFHIDTLFRCCLTCDRWPACDLRVVCAVIFWGIGSPCRLGKFVPLDFHVVGKELRRKARNELASEHLRAIFSPRTLCTCWSHRSYCLVVHMSLAQPRIRPSLVLDLMILFHTLVSYPRFIPCFIPLFHTPVSYPVSYTCFIPLFHTCFIPCWRDTRAPWNKKTLEG